MKEVLVALKNAEKEATDTIEQAKKDAQVLVEKEQKTFSKSLEEAKLKMEEFKISEIKSESKTDVSNMQKKSSTKEKDAVAAVTSVLLG